MKHPAHPQGHLGSPVGSAVTGGGTVVDDHDLSAEVATQPMQEACHAAGVIVHRYDDSHLALEEGPLPGNRVQQPAGDQAARQRVGGASRPTVRGCFSQPAGDGRFPPCRSATGQPVEDARARLGQAHEAKRLATGQYLTGAPEPPHPRVENVPAL
jgi:hypothetical protein